MRFLISEDKGQSSLIFISQSRSLCQTSGRGARHAQYFLLTITSTPLAHAGALLPLIFFISVFLLLCNGYFLSSSHWWHGNRCDCRSWMLDVFFGGGHWILALADKIQRLLIRRATIGEDTILLVDLDSPPPDTLVLQISIKPVNYVSTAMSSRFRKIGRFQFVYLDFNLSQLSI